MKLNFEKRHKQTAVYWAPNGNSGSGNTTYAAGVELACRWQDEPVVVKDANGKNVETRSTVNFDGALGVVEDGKLFLGLLTDLTAPQIADPAKTSDAHRIAATKDIPNMKQTQSLLKAFVE